MNYNILLKLSVKFFKIAISFFYFTIKNSDSYIIFSNDKYYTWNSIYSKWESLQDLLIYKHPESYSEIIEHEKYLIQKYNITIQYGFNNKNKEGR